MAGSARPETGRLRVAVDATPLLGTRTGVGRFCEGALGALATRSDLDVSAFAVTWRRRRRLPPAVPPGVRVHQRAMPARPLHLAWARVGRPGVEWFVGPEDVVHGTNFVVPPCRWAARVVTVHDLTTLRFPELCDRSTLGFPRLVRRAIAEGAWVHTPSRFVADEVVAEFAADPAKVRAVHHGIPRPHVFEGAPEAAAEPGRQGAGGAGPHRGAAPHLPPGVTRYVLAVGTVEPRKDYPGLVRAFAAVAAGRPDVALVVAGADGWGADAFHEAVHASPVADRVLQLGYVSDEALGRWVAGAVVLAFASVYEGFGFPPLEAMAAGVPVVATAAGAVPEVVGDAALLVAPRDVDALAGALARVLDDEGRRAGLVARGRQRAGLFSWEACAAGLAELYADASRAR
ncbi:MAG TPA: glycosyltransferase family 1 protein [Acidimicrobiales bacterium]|nr:glycosyltransferase family 1 protein [Acidimicrobiales bacterium]